MKFTIKITSLFSIAAMAVIALPLKSLSQVTQEDPTELQQEFDIKIDKLGDATWQVSQKMTQAQWENFKGGPLVNDPSISKRDMERAMSTYVIDDFKRDIDDMNRTVKMTLVVRAMAQYKGNGHWELPLTTKNQQITKLSDNAIMSTSNVLYGGHLTAQVYKIYFPDGSKSVEQTSDSFGNIVFTYRLGGSFLSFLTWNNILGALMIIASVALFLMSKKSPDYALLFNAQKRLTPHITFGQDKNIQQGGGGFQPGRSVEQGETIHPHEIIHPEEPVRKEENNRKDSDSHTGGLRV